MNRQKANEEIVELLSTLVKENPDQRFHQILRNYGFITEKSTESAPQWINEFYTEPETVLNRVKDKISELKSQ